MALSKFEKLASSVCSAVMKDARHRQGEAEWQIKGYDFSVPSDIVKKIMDYANNAEAMKKFRVKDPNAYDQMLEFKNIIRVFGETCRPTFLIGSGALSAMYSPGIYKSTPKIKELIGDYDFCVRIGDSYLPIFQDKEKEEWVTKGGKEEVVLRFDYGTVQSQEGDIKVAIANAAIGGSSKASEKFTTRIGVKRDEKNKKKEAYTPNVVLEAFNENNVEALKEMLTTPPTGGGWTYQFSDEKFDFGKYPIVSLKKEKRTSGLKSWFNYVVVVIDSGDSEVNVRLDNKDQPIWNMMSNFYPWIDENGITHNDSGTDEDDFLSFIDGGNSKYCLVYFGKIKKQRNSNGQIIDYFESMVNFEETDTQSFQKLTDKEIAQYSGGKVAVAVTPKTKITGVDDLLGDDTQDGIPF